MLALLATALMLQGCASSDASAPRSSAFSVRNDRVTLDPSGSAPLAATIHVETSMESRVSVRVAGRRGAASDVVKDFDAMASSHDVPIFGLYPGTRNTVELTFRSASGEELGRKSFAVTTASLPFATYPQIVIDTRREGMLAPGMNLVSYFGYNTASAPQRPFIFDEFGDIRWYLDFGDHPILQDLFYDNGLERLQNGNWYFGDASTASLYEVDMFGTVVNSWPLPGFAFHHNVQEKPNGNLLVTVSKQGLATVEDFVVELDRASKAIVRTWDLRRSLQPGRRALTGDAGDWFHGNAVAYDPSDNTIIVSGRTQGLVKLDEGNRVVWILGAHRGWGIAGDGTDLTTRLLQPLDAAGQPIADPAVLDGRANHADFEWNWYQHAPLVRSNGHLMLFDNGDNRNFGGSPAYSRAVEYVIDAAAMTVRQVWAYGKGRGTATYSRIVSDVDYIEGVDHVIWSPGAIGSATPSGKLIEVDYATQQVLFEATLTPPTPLFGITLHRTERLSLYP